MANTLITLQTVTNSYGDSVDVIVANNGTYLTIAIDYTHQLNAIMNSVAQISANTELAANSLSRIYSLARGKGPYETANLGIRMVSPFDWIQLTQYGSVLDLNNPSFANTANSFIYKLNNIPLL